ncbi:MAG: ATP-binding protein, partial [Planctomycetota bacterium]
GPQPHALTVSTHQQSDWVQVAVTDTGCGISRAIEPHLFEPFQTTKRDGLGMGLAISRSIVEEHAGRLWMEPNRPQRGVTFWFSLPSMNQS